MNRIPYRKVQATGNSFLVVEPPHASILVSRPKLIERTCSVGFGLGTNGLVVLRTGSPDAFEMNMYNPNGTRAEICGNALLCVGGLLAQKESTNPKTFKAKTDSGTKTVRALSNNNGNNKVEVDMGKPSFQDKGFNGTAMEAVQIKGRDFYYASMGNPHAVGFVTSFDFDLHEQGKLVENTTKTFPNKTNVEFVVADDDGLGLKLRVWERGAGETLGCGTGACAAVVAATEKGRLQRGKPIRVRLPGGDLLVHWKANNHVWMRGETQTIAEGTLFLPDLN